MSELQRVNNEVFLDRDGKTFETLINYLRNDGKVFPEFKDKNSENMFYEEMDYWGIDQHTKNSQETMGVKGNKADHITYNQEELK